jgi:hypothetical protein
MVGSDGLDGGPPPTSPGRSHEFEVTMAHTSSNSGKKGTHAVSLANSSQRARLRLFALDCYFFLLPSSVLAKVSEKLLSAFFFRGASTRSKGDDGTV